MRKARVELDDDLRAEYDFATLRGVVRGKYANCAGASRVVRLEADVAEAFRSDLAVNEALRAILAITRAVKLAPRIPTRRAAAKKALPMKSAGRRAVKHTT